MITKNHTKREAGDDMKLYMMVTTDKYQLPRAVAESIVELSKITGVSKATIQTTLCRTRKDGKARRFAEVIVDDDEKVMTEYEKPPVKVYEDSFMAVGGW